MLVHRSLFSREDLPIPAIRTSAPQRTHFITEIIQLRYNIITLTANTNLFVWVPV
jgi:hypothetical protein